MSIEKIIEFAGAAPESDKNTNELDLSRGFPSRLHPARQWFNYLFNTVTKKINEIIDEKLDIDANAVSASKLQTQRTVSFSGDATGSFGFDGSQNESATLTLANSGVSANTYGGAFKIPVVTVNAKGLITGVSTQDIQNASATQKGVVQIGVGLSVSNGVISSNSLGFNQSWQDVTNERELGSTYTNNTGKPIQIFIRSTRKSDSSQEFFFYLNGESWGTLSFIHDSYPSQLCCLSPIIPPGATYRIDGSTSTSMSLWRELR